jgi:hypothetical protein
MNPFRSPANFQSVPFLAVLVAFSLLNKAGADEGLWTYNDPPTALLTERYGFTPSPTWLEHCQKSSIRFEGGDSGAFVSQDGLAIAAYQTVSTFLRRFSDDRHDYVRDGFRAAALSDERPCAGLELDVLDHVEDVTAQMKAAIGKNPGEKNARTLPSAIASLEKESSQKTGFHCEVVPLFGGSKYHLYHYKRYTDVRLVFAPEKQAAKFGGGDDALEYPRTSFDFCLLRAYENGKPAKPQNFLKFSSRVPAEDDLVFVSGSPAPNRRGLTWSELNYLRDNEYPFQLQWLYRQETLLRDWSARSPGNARRAEESLAKISKRRKEIAGKQGALLDPGLTKEKWAAEKKLREAVTTTPELQDTIPSWDRITVAQRIIAAGARRCAMLEDGLGLNSSLFDLSRLLLRSSREKSIPSPNRQPAYQDANLPALEKRLFSDEPIDEELEILKLGDSLSWLAGEMGASEFSSSGEPDPVLEMVLADQAPLARAAAVVEGTKLKDISVRKEVYGGGLADLIKAGDPMVDLVQAVNSDAQRLGSIRDIQEEIKGRDRDKIAAARKFLSKSMLYPEADSSLRFAFGTIQGYEYLGEKVPYQTTLGMLFERSAARSGQPAYELPVRWTERRARLDLATPLNFVASVDIAGGFPGAPVIDKAGEFVGIAFDGNAQSLALDFAYSEQRARVVALTSLAIVEALRRVYDAPDLAAELESGKYTRH